MRTVVQSESTALMLAAENGHTGCVRLLVERGADEKAADYVRVMLSPPVCLFVCGRGCMCVWVGELVDGFDVRGKFSVLFVEQLSENASISRALFTFFQRFYDSIIWFDFVCVFANYDSFCIRLTLSFDRLLLSDHVSF